MIDTVEKALYPLRLVMFVVGFGIYRNRLNHARRRLSILYMFILWIIYAYLFSYMVILFTPEYIFPHFMQIFMVIINLFVTSVSIINTIRQQEVYLPFTYVILISLYSFIALTACFLKRLSQNIFQFRVVRVFVFVFIYKNRV